jgi:hypothetical protein
VVLVISPDVCDDRFSPVIAIDDGHGHYATEKQEGETNKDANGK